jgi:hypothetical protein
MTITSANILSAKRTNTHVGHHQLKSTFTYRLSKNGVVEDITREKVQRIHGAHKHVGTCNNSIALKNKIVAMENGRIQTFPVTHRVTISKPVAPTPTPPAKPSPTINPAQMARDIVFLKAEVSKLTTDVDRLTKELLEAKRDKQQILSELAKTQEQLAIVINELGKK